MDLKTFLLARIAEDEAEANGQLGAEYYTDGAWPEEVAARVLAECAAKRAIVDRHRRDPDVQRMIYGDIYPCTECGDADDSPMEWPCPTMRILAAVYADHPDYQSEWAQEASQA